jgi:hypothetical protein
MSYNFESAQVNENGKYSENIPSINLTIHEVNEGIEVYEENGYTHIPYRYFKNASFHDLPVMDIMVKVYSSPFYEQDYYAFVIITVN